MSADYYETLDVSRDATQADIQKAFHKLARKYHPDLNPGDKKAKEKFQQIQKAYEVLNDPDQRAKYDRFGPAFEGAAEGAPGGWQHAAGGFDEIDLSQLFGGAAGGGDPMGGFGDIFRHFAQQQTHQQPGPNRRGGRRGASRGANVEHQVEIPFRTAVLGGEVRLNIRRQGQAPETLEVKVPPGVREGQSIRLRGKGEPGGNMPGDLLLTVHIQAHPHYSRRDDDLIVRVPVTLGEAVGGAKVDVPTPWGTIAVKIPPGTSSGKRLRLKGQGVKANNREPGDLYVEVQIAIPSTVDSAAQELARQFDERATIRPREELSW